MQDSSNDVEIKRSPSSKESIQAETTMGPIIPAHAPAVFPVKPGLKNQEHPFKNKYFTISVVDWGRYHTYGEENGGVIGRHVIESATESAVHRTQAELREE
jgi:hypothetical protein